jgi:hypothetical protein
MLFTNLPSTDQLPDHIHKYMYLADYMYYRTAKKKEKKGKKAKRRRKERKSKRNEEKT